MNMNSAHAQVMTGDAHNNLKRMRRPTGHPNVRRYGLVSTSIWAGGVLVSLVHRGHFARAWLVHPVNVGSRLLPFPRTRNVMAVPRRRAGHLPGVWECRSSISRLPMVFDLSESRIERLFDQKSTQDLIDLILNECLRTSARRPIMRQFDPASYSIWKHWNGTIIADTWQSALRHALWAVAIYFVIGKNPGLCAGLSGFNHIWGEILLAVTTFTLTFFVNEAYSCWRTCLTICYTLQGRMNDFGMILAGCARRIESSNPSQGTTTYSIAPASRKVLQVVARYMRLFTILSYASFTRSHRPLLTRQGMRRMVARGLMTDKEQRVLMQSHVAATSRHNVVLMWMFRIALDAHRVGHLEGGHGFEQHLLGRIQEIRAQGNLMSNVLKGRMPFAYAHIVQVLVDAVLWLYPVMAISSGLPIQLGAFGSVVLTLCYEGLYNLAKRFLDPFHNENFWKGDDPLNVDTLIAESNSGSLRWLYSLEEMPFSLAAIQKGSLDEFVLPDEGYTVEETLSMEIQQLTVEPVLVDNRVPGHQQPQSPLQQQKQEHQQTQKQTKPVVMVVEGPEPTSPDESLDHAVKDSLEAVVEEFEETSAILKTPPGFEFVPGVDDHGESLAYLAKRGQNATMSGSAGDNTVTASKNSEVSTERYDQFLDLAKAEYAEAKARLD